MFTQEEYLWAWFFYLLGAGLFIGVVWYFTGKIKWREPKYVLRILVSVFLVVPWYTEAHEGYLSPAWIISVIEGVFEGPEAFWRAGTPLIVALILALILSSLVSILLWYMQRRRVSAE